ncbi:unnamed protein product [Blepharisma stoltei]|uniref:ER membrane protein complex subunit 1 n=1 Tax=Blepharisma stoltei TaxID=1481888 RepID=A0AAU9K9P9_9CILI|nr:unnamed protein product [Blepharisma stoltei]
MLVRYLIILFFVSSLSIRKEFETLYLLETEFSEIKLSDYFAGENLRYSIEDRNSSSDLATIQSAHEFDLVSFLPYPNSRKTLPSESFTTWISDSNQIIVWFNANQIVLYIISLITGEATEIWNWKIESEYQNLQIQETRYLSKLQCILIWAKQQEHLEGSIVWRNDFYVMDVNNLNYPTSPTWTNFSEPTYSSKLVLPYVEDSSYFPIYCEFENDPSISNSIYIYFLTDALDQPILVQSISEYYSVFLSQQKLSIVGALMDYSKISVLDANFGLIIFKYSFTMTFIEDGVEDLRHLGTLRSMTALSLRKIFIFSDIGISLYIRNIVKESSLRFHLKNNQNLNWTNIQESSNYYFIQSHDSLSVVDKNSASPEVMLSIDITNLGTLEQINSKLLFFSSLHLGLYCARFEKAGLKVYKVSIKGWSLKVHGNSTSVVKVKATDFFGASVTSNLHVISVKKQSQEIFPNEKGSWEKQESLIIYENKTGFILDVNSYFLGPNLKFDFKFPELKQFHFELSPRNKLTLLKNLTLPEEIKNFATFPRYSWIYFYQDRIYIESMSNPNVNWTIETSNPIKATTEIWDNAFIYRQSDEGVYFISIASISSLSIIHEFETGMECLLFSLCRNIIICGNRDKIETYIFIESRSKKIDTLTVAELDNNFHWNAENLLANYNNYNNQIYIYLFDPNQGVLAVNILSRGQFSQILELKSHGIKFIVSSDYFIGLVYDEKIDIYKGPWEYWKTILIEPNLKIVSHFARDYLVYLYTKDRLFIYDINLPTFGALYYSIEMKISDHFSYANDGSELVNFHSETEEKYAEIYTVSCEVDRFYYSSCILNYEINIFVSDWKEIKEPSYSMNFSVIAYNEENQLQRSFPLNIEVENLWNNSEKWEISRSIPYNENYEFDFSKVFFGQDMEKSLNLNGNYLSSSDKNLLPVFLTQRIEQVGEANNLKGRTIYSHTVIPHAGIVVITSETGFIIKNITGFSNETLLIPIQESQELQNLVCKQIESFAALKETKALIVTICTYKVRHTVFYSMRPTDLVENVNAIIFWEFDYCSLSFYQSKLLRIPTEIDFLRLATLDQNNFEIIVFARCNSLGHPFSDLWRLKGNWIESNVNLYDVEKINVLSLGLENICISLVDYKIKDRETVYWYMVDWLYGIRVIEARTNLPSIIAGGLKNSKLRKFLSMGICGNLLYLSEGGLKMESHQIENYANITKVKYAEYLSSSINFGYAKAAPIICSDDGRYAVFQLSQPNKNLSLSIFDINANANSNFIGKIILSLDHYSDPVSIRFIDNSTISIAMRYQSLYRSYKINKDHLIFPEMNESEYKKMIEKWGTKDFNMFITAVNENNAMNTSTISFTRENKSLESNLRRKNSFLIGIIPVLIIIFMLGFYLIKKIQKSKMKYPFETISTQSAGIYEDAKINKANNA